MENLQGHPQVLTGVVLLQPIPFGVSLARVPEQETWDTLLMEVLPLLSHLLPELVFISGAETCVWHFKEQQDYQMVPKSLVCSSIVRLSQSPCRAPSCSEPTHWDSIMHHSEHPELKLFLLERFKVWSREVLKVIQQQPKRQKFVP